MIKKTIKYKDWDGVEVEEDFWFNLDESEIFAVNMETGQQDFFEAVKIAQENNEMGVVIEAFKKLIVMSVGRREGKHFNKSDEIRDDLVKTNAYSALFMELATDPAAGPEFVNGIMPVGIQEAVANSKDETILAMKAKIEEMKLQDARSIETAELPAEEPKAWTSPPISNEVPTQYPSTD